MENNHDLTTHVVSSSLRVRVKWCRIKSRSNPFIETIIHRDIQPYTGGVPNPF